MKPLAKTSLDVTERDTIPDDVCTKECCGVDEDALEEEDTLDEELDDSSPSAITFGMDDSGYSAVPVVRSYW